MLIESYLFAKITSIINLFQEESNHHIKEQFGKYLESIIVEIITKHINIFKDLITFFKDNILYIIMKESNKVIDIAHQNIIILNQTKCLIRVIELEVVVDLIHEYENVINFFEQMKTYNIAHENVLVKWLELFKYIVENFFDPNIHQKLQPIKFISFTKSSKPQFVNLNTNFNNIVVDQAINIGIFKETTVDNLDSLLQKVNEIYKENIDIAKKHIEDSLKSINLVNFMLNEPKKVDLSKRLTKILYQIYEIFLKSFYDSDNDYGATSNLKDIHTFNQKKPYFTSMENIIIHPNIVLNILHNHKIMGLLLKNLKGLKFALDTLYLNHPLSFEFKEIQSMQFLSFDDHWLTTNSIDQLKKTWIYHERIHNTFSYFFMLFKIGFTSYTIAYVDEKTSIRFDSWKKKVIYFDVNISDYIKPIFDLLAPSGLIKYFIWGLKEYILLHSADHFIHMSMPKLIDIFYILLYLKDNRLEYFKLHEIPVQPRNQDNYQKIEDQKDDKFLNEWPTLNTNIVYKLIEKPLGDYKEFKKNIENMYQRSIGKPLILFSKEIGKIILENYYQIIQNENPLELDEYMRTKNQAGAISTKVTNYNKLRSARKTTLYQTIIIPNERYPFKVIANDNSLNDTPVKVLDRQQSEGIKHSSYKQMNLSSIHSTIAKNLDKTIFNNMRTTPKNNEKCEIDLNNINVDIDGTPKKYDMNESEFLISITPNKLAKLNFQKKGMNDKVNEEEKHESEVDSPLIRTIEKKKPKVKDSISSSLIFFKKKANKLQNFDVMIVFDSNIYNILFAIIELESYQQFKQIHYFYYDTSNNNNITSQFESSYSKKSITKHILKYFPFINIIILQNLQIIFHKLDLIIPKKELNIQLCHHNNLILHSIICTKYLAKIPPTLTIKDIQFHIDQNSLLYIDYALNKLPNEILELGNQLFPDGIINFFLYTTINNVIYISNEIIMSHYNLILKKSQKKFIILEFFEKNHIKVTALITHQSANNIKLIEYDICNFEKTNDMMGFPDDISAIKKALINSSNTIITDQLAKKIWNNEGITTYLIATLLNNNPTIEDFKNLCIKLKTNNTFLLDCIFNLIDDIYSIGFHKIFGTTLETAFAIDKAESIVEISKIFQAKLGLFYTNLLENWCINVIKGPIKKYNPSESEYLKFGLEKIGNSMMILLIPTDIKLDDIICFIIMTKNILVAGVYSDSLITKEAIFYHTDILRLYKERFTDIVSIDNIKLYKLELTNDIKKFKSNALVYLFMELLNKSLDMFETYINIEKYYSIWGDKNSTDLDLLIGDILNHPNYIRYKIFLNNNSFYNYTDQKVFKYFFENFVGKLANKDNVMNKTAKSSIQIFIIKEDKYGTITCFIIMISTLTKNGDNIAFYCVNLETKKEPLNLNILRENIISLLEELNINIGIVSPATINIKNRFNRQKLLAIQFLINLYLEKTDEIVWEVRYITKYILGLLNCQLFFFIELIKAYYYHSDYDINANPWRLP